MPKISLFDIGGRGVNVTTDPLHLDPTEVTKAQNAEPVTNAGIGGLDRRRGFQQLGTGSGAGSVALVFDVPTPAEADYTSYLYAGMVSGATHNWRRSTDGTTWENDDTPPKPSTFLTGVRYFKDWQKAFTYKNTLYFFSGTAPIHLYRYNGTAASDMGALPKNLVSNSEVLAVTDVVADGDALYCSVLDAAVTEPALPGRILRYVPVTNTWTQINQDVTFATNGAPASLMIWVSHLAYGPYIGADTTGTAVIGRIPYLLAASGGAGRQALASGTGVCHASAAVHLGKGYFGGAVNTATPASLFVTTPGAPTTFNTARTGNSSTTGNAWVSQWVYNNELYAAWADPGTTTGAIYKYDGSSWTLDKSLATTEVAMQAVTFSGNLYVVAGQTAHTGNTNTRILKRTATGTWSDVDSPTGAGEKFRGNLGILRIASSAPEMQF